MASGSIFFGIKSVIALTTVAAVGMVAYVNSDTTTVVENVQSFAIAARERISRAVKVEPPQVEVIPEKQTQPIAESAPTAETAKTTAGEEIVQSVQLPEFDIIRVEKDGSVLVAGRATANEVVNLVLSDGSVIGSGKAGPEGDFVILPDNPLKPGDYVINLRSRKQDGGVTASAQTGVVKVPEPGGEVLAMISEAGKASRIIVKPKPVSVTHKPLVEESVVAEIASPTVDPERVQSAEVAAVAPAKDAVPAKVEVQAEKSQPKPEITPEPEPETIVAATVQAPSKVAAEEPAAQLEPASPTQLPKVDELSKSAPRVIVEAVEVEKGQVFVAGEAPRDVLVRVYIDNDHLGTTKGTSDNRFIVSQNYALKPGYHAVRADVIDRKTGGVVSRAEVPVVHAIIAEEPAEEPATTVASAQEVPSPSLNEPIAQDLRL